MLNLNTWPTIDPFRGRRCAARQPGLRDDSARPRNTVVAWAWSGLRQAIAVVFVGLLLIEPLKAHEVVWWTDPDAPFPVLDFFTPEEYVGYVSVVPSQGEPCTVEVKLDAQRSTLIKAEVLPPGLFDLNPGNVVDIRVEVLRSPTGISESATISGEWRATGLPAGHDCTAEAKFTVPVLVLAPRPEFRIRAMLDDGWVKIDTGFESVLQASQSITGPWLNVGKGQMFSLNTDMPSGFYQRLRREGGLVEGTVTDDTGTPLKGVSLGLVYGGLSALTDLKGAYSFGRMPYGSNAIGITNAAGNASLDIILSTSQNVVAAVKAAMDAAAVAATPTNACNCTPWCAIGFATFPSGARTPVYYSGGANPPKVGAANCGEVSVTVTPPGGGAPIPLKPGTGRHQNSGPNPAAGTWTVTTVVCGITKTCTITVP